MSLHHKSKRSRFFRPGGFPLNRWTSKKSFWPLVGALGCLFVLAVAAPSSWHRYRSAPLASPEESVPTVAAPSFEDSLPASQEFDFDVLLRMRDTLLTIVDRLPLPEQTPEATTARRSVMVTSEKDRLAMLDVRQRPHRQRPRRDLPPRSAPEPAIERLTPAQAVQPLIRHHPGVLFEQLKALVHVPLASDWSKQVVERLRRLTIETPTQGNPTQGNSVQQTEAMALLQELRVLAEAGNDRALQVSSPATQQDWLQAAEALQRRLGIWEAMLAEGPPQVVVTDLPTSPASLMPVLDEVEALLATESNGSAWHEYLLLDSLASASSEGLEIDSKKRSKLAHQVLSRMADPRLTEAQADFLATSSLRDLRQQLQPWAAQAIDLDRLLALVERYEEGRELRYAEAIARVQQQLQWSSNPRWQTLAEHLKQHYRSANMRIAFSDALLNRMVQQPKATVTPVRERIDGTKVRGKARTTTSLQVRLLPDPNRWRFRLEAFGKVFSSTQSDTWPARVRNTAKMQYEVKKEIVIDQEGLTALPAKSSAKGRHELVGVDSQLDSVPLFGSLLREIARNKNQKSRPAAMSQVKAKVARQARRRMDKEADSKLSNLEQNFRDGVLAPIGQLALIADPLAIYTTPERAVMQLRLANDGQLGAHTPRPLAPSDSVASLQMHETVLNNALAGLDLDGRRMKLPELFQFFSEKFGGAAEIPEDLPTRTVLEFATRDAILVNCDRDHFSLTLSIRELAHGRDKIRNFRVHARFRPVLDGLAVKLVREGSLQFSSRRLKTGPRIVLHGVIGKLLPQGQEISLIASKLQDDPRFAGLMVTQLVIDDGWIGLALGPAHAERNAWRTQRLKVFRCRLCGRLGFDAFDSGDLSDRGYFALAAVYVEKLRREKTQSLQCRSY